MSSTGYSSQICRYIHSVLTTMSFGFRKFLNEFLFRWWNILWSFHEKCIYSSCEHADAQSAPDDVTDPLTPKCKTKRNKRKKKNEERTLRTSLKYSLQRNTDSLINASIWSSVGHRKHIQSTRSNVRIPMLLLLLSSSSSSSPSSLSPLY